jgi:hypothetical protein
VPAGDEAVGEAQQADTYETSAFYGTTGGTGPIGPGDTSGTPGTTPVDQIIGYAVDSTGTYIAGIDLYYTDGTHHLFGNTTDFQSTYTFPGGVINGVHVHVDSGHLRGIKFKSSIGTAFTVGYLNGTEEVFDDPSATFTDMQVYTGTLHTDTVIWGASFDYTLAQ